MVCAAVLFATASSDASRPTVTLRIHPCAAVPGAEVRRLAGMELGTLFADEDAAATSPMDVQVECEADLITLRVNDQITGKQLIRSITLAEAPPNARGRILALAVVELIQASWSELETNPSPKVPPAGVSPP